jgi:hypothetical protein
VLVPTQGGSGNRGVFRCWWLDAIGGNGPSRAKEGSDVRGVSGSCCSTAVQEIIGVHVPSYLSGLSSPRVRPYCRRSGGGRRVDHRQSGLAYGLASPASRARRRSALRRFFSLNRWTPSCHCWRTSGGNASRCSGVSLAHAATACRWFFPLFLDKADAENPPLRGSILSRGARGCPLSGRIDGLLLKSSAPIRYQRIGHACNSAALQD